MNFRPLVFIYFLVCLFTISAVAQDKKLNYLALGDSYTIGESVAVSQRWPVQLTDALREKGLEIEEPKIIAKTGWTTGQLDSAISKADLNPPYFLVSLLIGVNDQYRGYDIEKYPSNFLNLLQRAISFAGGNASHVLVVSIPDYGVTPFGQQKNPQKIARELDRYNSINKSISDSLGVNYVNITPISKKARTDSSLLASDHLHPSGAMYQQWVEKVMPVILPNLKD